MEAESANKTLKIAHRGASAYEPENTLRAFRRAIEMGCDMIEMDVRLTKDDKIVVIHDDSVDRTTNGRGKVRHKTLEELKGLDAGKGERIPTLAEAIDFIGIDAGIVVEIKESGMEKGVVEALRRSDALDRFQDRCWVVSFKKNALTTLRELEPSLKTGLLVTFASDPIADAHMLDVHAVGLYHLFINENMISKAAAHNIVPFAWTVNGEGRVRKLQGMGIGGIVTDKPDIF